MKNKKSFLCKVIYHDIDYSWTKSFQVTDSICVDVYRCKRCGKIIEYANMEPTKEALQRYKEWFASLTEDNKNIDKRE